MNALLWFKYHRLSLLISLVALSLITQSISPTCTYADSCTPGLFTTVTNYALGAGDTDPDNAIGIGDFNNDTKIDLVATRKKAGSIYVLLGNGDGTFQSALITPIVNDYGYYGDPWNLAVGDYNGDNKQDIVAGFAYSWGWIYLAGKGNGTFEKWVYFNVDSAAAYAIAAGDFDGDTKRDVAVAQSNGHVRAHHGNGDGTFPWSTTVDLGGVSGWSIVAGYWNADSYLDLATANRYDNNVSVLLGDGSGGFSLATPATYSLGMVARSIKTRDLNADSKADLVVAGGGSTDSRIWVLLGNGNGTFQTPTSYPVTGTGGPFDVALADFDQDSRLDVVTANYDGNDISVFFGRGDGTFAAATRFGLNGGQAPTGVTVADFENNGRVDIATVNRYSTNASVLLNNCLFRYFLPLIGR